MAVTHSMSLKDLVPDSWINNKYYNSVDKNRYENTLNDRVSEKSLATGSNYRNSVPISK